MSLLDEIEMIKKINCNDGTITALCDVLYELAKKIEDKEQMGFKAK